MGFSRAYDELSERQIDILRVLESGLFNEENVRSHGHLTAISRPPHGHLFVREIINTRGRSRMW